MILIEEYRITQRNLPKVVFFLFKDVTTGQSVSADLHTTEGVTREKFRLNYKINCSLLFLRYNS